MKKGHPELYQAIEILLKVAKQNERNLQMPGDGRYQPAMLKPFFGYDQWAGWLIIVEWFWMKTLGEIGVMPEEDKRLMTESLLESMLVQITTTQQDIEEQTTKHDIIALKNLMRPHLPAQLKPWLHYCATSYDIINTAYALQLKSAFELAFFPELEELDIYWRTKIRNHAKTLQAGRTHLQTALPVTVGFWLAGLHNRFVNSARKAAELVQEIPGKFSGAVGTSASQRVLIKSQDGEKRLMRMLGLPVAEVSTQITPPEGMARFYHELVLLSGAMANLGEDVRILQSSQFGELGSDSSTSSAMSHKTANPIAAENIAGMHASVIAENMKVMMTLVSDLQRDLKWSNVMRSYSAAAVYVFQQILTAKRLMKSLTVNAEKCNANFQVAEKLVTAEIMHLALEREGLENASVFVNKAIIPQAMRTGETLWEAMQSVILRNYDSVEDAEIARIWAKIIARPDIKNYLIPAAEYLGDAVEIAERESSNKL